MSVSTAMQHDQAAQPPSRVREIAQLTLAHLINDIYAPVLMALQPLLITTLGYSYTQAALLPVMHSLISSILQPVFGSLSDKRGFRVSVAVSVLLSGCGIAFLGLLSDHYLIMLCSVGIASVGAATFHPGALCKVAAIAVSSNRGRLTSLFIVGGNLGQALGPILGGIVITTGGLPAVTWLLIPAVLGALLLVVRPIPDICPVAAQQAEYSGEENWRPVILLFAGSTLRSWVTFGAMTFLPTYLVLSGYPLIEATFFYQRHAHCRSCRAAHRRLSLRPDGQKTGCRCNYPLLHPRLCRDSPDPGCASNCFDALFWVLPLGLVLGDHCHGSRAYAQQDRPDLWPIHGYSHGRGRSRCLRLGRNCRPVRAHSHPFPLPGPDFCGSPALCSCGIPAEGLEPF